MGGLWREVNYTMTRFMHSEGGRICRGAVGEGGPIRGGLLYLYYIDVKCDESLSKLIAAYHLSWNVSVILESEATP